MVVTWHSKCLDSCGGEFELALKHAPDQQKS